MKPQITHVLLDENEILDLVCEKHNLSRKKASMNINYVENNHEVPGSWIIQVQAPGVDIEEIPFKKENESLENIKSKVLN